jgi:hypothetical protein
MKPIERFAVSIESPPWGAIYKVAIGMATPPIFHVLLGDADSFWMILLLFIGILLSMRVIPIVVRHILPFSAEAQEIWRSRRNLSKRYDSYAWQKLFWFGLGLALYAVIGGLRYAELELTLVCLIAGGVGLVMWLRKCATE